jgi:sugar/nucleoside kinase (ribokinase family)
MHRTGLARDLIGIEPCSIPLGSPPTLRPMPLICTGTIGIDTVYTPHGHREKILGGSCTYFAAAASFYGPVRIVAAAGDDFPPAFHDTLKSFKGVDATGLEIRKGSKTFAWGGKYHDNMNTRETLFTELGVLAERPPAIPPKFHDSQYVFLANSHPAVQMGMLDALKNRKLAVADTMDLWINIARAELDLLLTKIDGLVLNYDEAELLTGKSNTVAAARAILHMGPKFVVVKKGEHGCLLVHKDGIAALPAYPTETVIDPTGAGDSFAGGMMGHIAAHGLKTSQATGFNTLRESLAHGTIIASFNIESFSLERLSKLTRAELDRRYAEYVSMVRV